MANYKHFYQGLVCPIIILLSWSLTLSTCNALEVPKEAADYDASFFEQHRKIAGVYHLLVKHIRLILPEINNPPFSVVDVGCGHGLLVEAWRAAGIAESHGLEGSASAKTMWPSQYLEYYQIQDLTIDTVFDTMPPTDLVTTFEVAEHLPEESADHFVALLTSHLQATIVFGAATRYQDQGRNPSHVNENTYQYWIEKFGRKGYAPDLAATAKMRHQLIMDPDFGKYFSQAWWYPKNVFIFSNVSDINKQIELDMKLASHPKEADMRGQSYLSLAGDGAFGQLWRRDWTEFANIF